MRFRARTGPEEFKVFGYRGRHPDWERKAGPVVRRVAGLWHSVGRSFPVDEIMALATRNAGSGFRSTPKVVAAIEANCRRARGHRELMHDFRSASYPFVAERHI